MIDKREKYCKDQIRKDSEICLMLFHAEDSAKAFNDLFPDWNIIDLKD